MLPIGDLGGEMATQSPVGVQGLPLLLTKLYIPPIRSEMVSRPHLLERLDAGLYRKLTLISAPAGFGKTTLVGEWIASHRAPTSCLALARRGRQRHRSLSDLSRRGAADHRTRHWKRRTGRAPIPLILAPTVDAGLGH